MILEGLPDLGSFFTKPPEPQYIVYHWGGGASTPTKLLLPQHDADIIQVASGRTMKTGVTGGGRMIIWDSNKKAVDVPSGATADKEKMLEDLWVPRFLEGQSGVTIVQVSCGDLFVACLTGMLSRYTFLRCPLMLGVHDLHDESVSLSGVSLVVCPRVGVSLVMSFHRSRSSWEVSILAPGCLQMYILIK